jgi:hypothetical protein
VKHYLVDFDSDGDARDRARLRHLEEDIDAALDAPALSFSDQLGPCKGVGAYPFLP